MTLKESENLLKLINEFHSLSNAVVALCDASTQDRRDAKAVLDAITAISRSHRQCSTTLAVMHRAYVEKYGSLIPEHNPLSKLEVYQ